MRKDVIFNLVISVVTLVFSSSVSAEACYEMSPNLQAAEKTYYDLLVDKPLTREETKIINKLNKALEGNWKGTAEAVQCLGSIKSPKSRNITSKVTATAQKGTDIELMIKADMYIEKAKVTKGTNLYLFQKDNMFNVKFVGDKSIEYADRRRRNTDTSSQFLETINVIEIDGKNLNLKFSHYVNGDLASYEKWTLRKTR